MSNPAHRRLLDLLAGWSAFLDELASADDVPMREEYAREAEAIADLYQEAGGADGMTDDDVTAFLNGPLRGFLREGTAHRR